MEEGKTRICGTEQMVANKNILFYLDFEFESKEIGNVVVSMQDLFLSHCFFVCLFVTLS